MPGVLYGNTFDLISWSPATKVCLLSQNNSAVQSQKALSVYFTSNIKEILPFEFAGKNCDPCTLNSLDFFHDTMCDKAHLKKFKQWRPNAGGTGLKSLGLLQVFKLACFAT